MQILFRGHIFTAAVDVQEPKESDGVPDSADAKRLRHLQDEQRERQGPSDSRQAEPQPVEKGVGDALAVVIAGHQRSIFKFSIAPELAPRFVRRVALSILAGELAQLAILADHEPDPQSVCEQRIAAETRQGGQPEQPEQVPQPPGRQAAKSLQRRQLVVGGGDALMKVALRRFVISIQTSRNRKQQKDERIERRNHGAGTAVPADGDGSGVGHRRAVRRRRRTALRREIHFDLKERGLKLFRMSVGSRRWGKNFRIMEKPNSRNLCNSSSLQEPKRCGEDRSRWRFQLNQTIAP